MKKITFTQQEWDRAVDEVMDMPESQEGARVPAIRFRTVGAVIEEHGALDQRRHFLAGILREGELSMLAGRALAGKSTTAEALTRALTLGIPFLGCATIKCRVGYRAQSRAGDL